MNLAPMLVATFAAAATACHTIQPVRRPAEFIPAQRPPMLWVTHESGEVMVLTNARVDGEHVVGTWAGLQEEVRVPLSQARLVEARQFNAKKTAILGGVLGVTGATVAYLVIKATGKATPCYNPEPGGPNPHQCN